MSVEVLDTRCQYLTVFPPPFINCSSLTAQYHSLHGTRAQVTKTLLALSQELELLFNDFKTMVIQDAL